MATGAGGPRLTAERRNPGIPASGAGNRSFGTGTNPSSTPAQGPRERSFSTRSRHVDDLAGSSFGFRLVEPPPLDEQTENPCRSRFDITAHRRLNSPRSEITCPARFPVAVRSPRAGLRPLLSNRVVQPGAMARAAEMTVSSGHLETSPERGEHTDEEEHHHSGLGAGGTCLLPFGQRRGSDKDRGAPALLRRLRRTGQGPDHGPRDGLRRLRSRGGGAPHRTDPGRYRIETEQRSRSVQEAGLQGRGRHRGRHHLLGGGRSGA